MLCQILLLRTTIAQIGNFAEYLYYFPKSAIFMIIVMLMYVIYLNEEYTSGFIKMCIRTKQTN